MEYQTQQATQWSHQQTSAHVQQQPNPERSAYQFAQQSNSYQGQQPQQNWWGGQPQQQMMPHVSVSAQVPVPNGPNPYIGMNQQEVTEQQQRNQQRQAKSEKAILKADQKDMQQAYLKATPQEKRTQKFFKELPIENMIDHEAIAYARQAGIFDPVFKTGRMSNSLVQKMNYMKSKHRSNILLRKWPADGYWCRQNDLLKVHDPATFTDTIERVNANELTVEEFLNRFERGSKPCIITGVTETWSGQTEWQLKRLVERFGHSLFKIGESDSGRKLKVTLKEYIEYALFNRDDSPLYLFESNIEEHETMKAIVNEYNPPKYLRRDFFVELMGENKAPPHRWFLIGPRRSGSEVHQDPLGTSAWNTSVCGHKRWVMMPPGPGITKKLVRGEHLAQKGEDDEAIQYFDKILPRLKAQEGPQGTNRLPVIIEGVQYPGETIFVPGNWWHGVLNLDLTIAITQNFCNEGNFDKVWFRTRKGRKKLSVRFLNKLQQHHPDLYQKAIQMNKQDKFVMWDKRKKYAAYFALKKNKKDGVVVEETKSANAAMQEEEDGAAEESSNDTISSSSSSSSSSLTSSSSDSDSEVDGSSSSSSNTGDSVNDERKKRRAKAAAQVQQKPATDN